jgi:hypothetical protein
MRNSDEGVRDKGAPPIRRLYGFVQLPAQRSRNLTRVTEISGRNRCDAYGGIGSGVEVTEAAKEKLGVHPIVDLQQALQ